MQRRVRAKHWLSVVTKHASYAVIITTVCKLILLIVDPFSQLVCITYVNVVINKRYQCPLLLQ